MTAPTENTATAPATPPDSGAPDLDGVLAAGEELRREISDRTRECRERYLSRAGELRVVPVYEEIRRALRDRPRVVSESGVGEMAAAVQHVTAARDALRGLQVEYESACYVALDPSEEYLWNGEVDICFAKGSVWRARTAIENAAMRFPMRWVERSNAAGPLRATLGESGEYESVNADGYPSGAVCVPLESARLRVGRDDLAGSAVHELAHRFQDTVPDLAALERAFFERRTSGSPARRLDVFGSDGFYRDGDFCDPYAGRDPDLDAHPSEGHEVFPVGTDAMLGCDLETFELFLRHGDTEHEAFVLGCLVSL